MKVAAKVHEQDGELWIEIPHSIVNSMGLKENQIVQIEIIDGGILVKPSAHGWMAGTVEELEDIVESTGEKWDADI